ncbi:hypothetical protein Tco_1250461, partial [Tanacetum coccineum]
KTGNDWIEDTSVIGDQNDDTDSKGSTDEGNTSNSSGNNDAIGLDLLPYHITHLQAVVDLVRDTFNGMPRAPVPTEMGEGGALLMPGMNENE